MLWNFAGLCDYKHSPRCSIMGQYLIALSSCEAEHIALSEMMREALWLWKLRPLIGLVFIVCCNTGAPAKQLIHGDGIPFRLHEVYNASVTH
jgi:hypothetical protein